MFITKKHLPRRTFLKGVGASLSLPLLDAMIPAGTALAQTAAAAKPKMGFFYLPHGAVISKWVPAATGLAERRSAARRRRSKTVLQGSDWRYQR